MNLSDNLKWRAFIGRIHYLPAYLKDLSALLQREVSAEELWSLPDTEAFFKKSREVNLKMVFKETLNFSDKLSLLRIAHENVEQWDSPYMMYLSDVETCGLLEIPTLSCFNWNFQFTDEHCGIIFFIRKDKREKIVLDFYEEYSEYFIDVEVFR